MAGNGLEARNGREGLDDLEERAIIAQPTIQNQSVSIRRDFARKVYTYVVMLMLINASVAAAVIFSKRLQHFLYKHNFLVMMLILLIIIFQCFHFAIFMNLLPSCLSGIKSLHRKYVWMLKTSPQNLIFLFTYSAITGLMSGIWGSMLHKRTLGVLLLVYLAVVVTASIYAMSTKTDFSKQSRTMEIYFKFLLMLLFVSTFVHNPLVNEIISGLWALLFMFFMIMETQLSFGSRDSDTARVEYTVDMYASVAYHLFHCFFNLFISSVNVVNK